MGCAIVLHLLLLEWSASASWLQDQTNTIHPKLFILKKDESLQSLTPTNRAQQTFTNDEQKNSLSNFNNTSSDKTVIIDKTDLSTEALPNVIDDFTSKPPLLELSDAFISSDQDNSEAEAVFSATLRAKIEKAKQDQEAYLKGQQKETAYPITEDADGTKYVNIEGVCWRIPEPGSEEAWAIVFAGCNGQKETFHFELNIAPSIFLGPDAAFPLSE